jgi:hypothetical protein
MSWSTAFTTSLTGRSSRAWRYTLSRINASYTDNPGTSISIGSNAGANLPVLVGAPVIAGAGVSPGQWVPQVAGCTVGVAVSNAAAFATLATSLPRGTMVQIQAQDMLNTSAGPERIFLGSVESMNRVGTQCTLTLRDIRSALRTRISATQGSLFHETADTDTLGGSYNAGATTITLSGAVPSAFAVDTTSTRGAVRIDPTTGDPFYLTFTGTSGSTLTGVASSAVMGTTAVNAAIGDVVTPCAWLEGNPIDIALRILTSTGTAANGTDDTMPASWGYALPHAIIDRTDAILAREIVTPYPAPSTAASYHVAHAVDSSQPAGFDWLSSFLALFGVWIVVRQGSISFRATTDPKHASLEPISTPLFSAGRANIIEVSRGEVYGATVAVRWYNQIVKFNGGTAFGGTLPPTTRILPAEPHGRDSDQPDLTRYLDTQADADDVAQRVLWWNGYPPHVFELSTTMGLAEVAEGDWLALDLDLVGDDYSPDYSAASTRRKVMVIGVDYDWQQQQCRLTVANTSAT